MLPNELRVALSELGGSGAAGLLSLPVAHGVGLRAADAAELDPDTPTAAVSLRRVEVDEVRRDLLPPRLARAAGGASREQRHRDNEAEADGAGESRVPAMSKSWHQTLTPGRAR
jgi:hypothetical protein